eukprot:1244999-Karenia_brevis.AAC.1
MGDGVLIGDGRIGSNSPGDGLVAEALRKAGVAPCGAKGEPIWIYAETVGKHLSGTVLAADAVKVVVENKGVATLADGSTVFIKKQSVAAGEQLSEIATVLEEGRNDARVLPLRFDSAGKRYGDFKVMLDSMRNQKSPDWPVAGPQTVLWLLKHMWNNGGSPM